MGGSIYICVGGNNYVFSTYSTGGSRAHYITNKAGGQRLWGGVGWVGENRIILITHTLTLFIVDIGTISAINT